MPKLATTNAAGLTLTVEYDIDGTPIADVSLDADPRYGASILWAAHEESLYKIGHEDDVLPLTIPQIAAVNRWMEAL